jgi:flagellar basal-body rod protein FlgB
MERHRNGVSSGKPPNSAKQEENMAGLFNTTSFRMMEQSLRVLSMQRDVISHNLTNIDTPGYDCKYLSFSGVLRDKMSARQGEVYKKELHIKPEIYIDEITKMQPDGNNVDYVTQSALLKKNALKQEAIQNQLDAEFRMLRAAMRKN